MKKYLTLRNAVLCGAAVLVLAAFIMSFFVSLQVTAEGEKGAYLHILWGCDKGTAAGKVVPISDMGMFSADKLKPMGLPLAGLIMMVVATIGAILVALFVKKSFAKYVVAGLGLVILAGGIMQFWPVESFARAYVHSFEGIEEVSKSTIDYAIEQHILLFKEMNAHAPIAVVMGVFGCLSGVAVVASQFLPEKELVK